MLFLTLQRFKESDSLVQGHSKVTQAADLDAGSLAGRRNLCP